MILDVGPATTAALEKQLGACKTLLWNCPLGAFEVKPFDAATDERRQSRGAISTRDGKLVSVAGGGDTVAALNAAQVADDFSYVSTAGGAFLQNGSKGKDLPGVKALGA